MPRNNFIDPIGVPAVPASRLVLAISLFLVVFHNYAFFRSVLAVYPFSWGRVPFLASVFLALTCLTYLFLLVFGWRHTLKPLLVLVLTVSSVASYFMNTFNVVIDVEMLRNVAQTDFAETRDLASVRLLGYFLFLGVLPSALVLRARVRYGTPKAEALSKLKHAAAAVLVLAVTGFAFSGNYYSFLREHKRVRLYANPAAWVYSASKISFGSRKAEAKASGRSGRMRRSRRPTATGSWSSWWSARRSGRTGSR